jgi:small-conductance mechanosensitive channel
MMKIELRYIFIIIILLLYYLENRLLDDIYQQKEYLSEKLKKAGDTTYYKSVYPLTKFSFHIFFIALLFIVIGYNILNLSVKFILQYIGIFGFYISYILQKLFTNIISKMLISIKFPNLEKKYVKINNIQGKVISKELLSVVLEKNSGEYIYISNNSFFQGNVEIYDNKDLIKFNIKIKFKYKINNNNNIYAIKSIVLDLLKNMVNEDKIDKSSLNDNYFKYNSIDNFIIIQSIVSKKSNYEQNLLEIKCNLKKKIKIMYFLKDRNIYL